MNELFEKNLMEDVDIFNKEKKVTERLLSACIFSCNFRAKIYRTYEYEYKEELNNIQNEYDKKELMIKIAKVKEQKKKFYYYKEKLLELKEPIEIHKETHIVSKTDDLLDCDISERFYLAYKIDNHLYHQPIRSENKRLYYMVFKKLPVIDVGSVYTKYSKEENADILANIIPLSILKNILEFYLHD